MNKFKFILGENIQLKQLKCLSWLQFTNELKKMWQFNPNCEMKIKNVKIENYDQIITDQDDAFVNCSHPGAIISWKKHENIRDRAIIAIFKCDGTDRQYVITKVENSNIFLEEI